MPASAAAATPSTSRGARTSSKALADAASGKAAGTSDGAAAALDTPELAACTCSQTFQRTARTSSGRLYT